MKDYLRFRDELARALDQDFYPLEYLDHLVSSGTAHITADADGIIVSQVVEYPGGARVVDTLVVAGALEAICGPLREKIEEWGRSVGCSRIIVKSRPGWARTLKQHGYEPHQLAVMKEL